MNLGYVTLGSDDLEVAERFYSAFLFPLGFSLLVDEDGLNYTAGGEEGAAPFTLYVRPPFDGRPASAGNGTMLAFRVPGQARVRALHAAALAAGGRDEGAPGFRASYGPHFFVGYLRDPQGHKIALYSSDPAEPARPD